MADDNSFPLVKSLSCLVAFLLFLLTAGKAWVANPVPLINQPLVPDAAEPGGLGFTLTVNGTGFVPGAVVTWNGSARATTFVSQSQVKATILSSDIIKPSTASVTVVSPGSGGGTSNVVSFPITAPSSSFSFRTSAYSAGLAPWAVATGDFNRDGKLDLAVTNFMDNTVSIFTGNGDGTFKALGTAATGQSPQGVVAADFNGDGKLDLAIGDDSGTVSILLGKGDGTFETRADYSTGTGAQAVAVGDFNRDGKLDLAVANYGPGFQNSTVLIFLGKGDGTFQPQVAYAAGVNPVGVLVGDFNRDGKLDLAVLDNNAPFGISILLGNGDGSFQNPVLYSAGTNSRVGIVADFNSDGKLDLAVANIGDNDVSILFGNGDGSFQAPVNYPVGTYPTALWGADFNGDGKLDLITANTTGNSVSVLLGNGNGTFQAHADYSTGPGPSGIGVGDFNADGRLDVAVADSNGSTVSILLQGPAVSLSKTDLTFADQVVGTSSASQEVTLADNELPLTISSIAVTGTNATDFSQTNTCGSGLPAGERCTINVTFKPTQLGPRTASVNITDNDAESPQMVTLSGTGVVSGPNATLSATSLTFATQLAGTSSPAQSITLTNYGTSALSITGIGFTGADPGDFAEASTCGNSVAPGANCTINVTFKPTGVNERTASLSIRDNAPGSPQAISLSGVGTLTVSLSKTNLTFANQGMGTSSASQPVTLANGAAPLTISSIAVTGTNATDFSQTNTCGSGLPAGGRCTIGVTFRPTQVGPRTASVNITDDAVGSPQTVALSGTGVVSGPNATLSATSLTLGTQLVGTSSPAQSITLTNYGTVALSITGIGFTGADPGDFAETNTCGNSVAPGASCTINVTFKPTCVNARNASLSVTDNAPGSPHTVSLTGEGTVVELNPTGLGFFVVGGARTMTSTLTNTGATTLTITGITITGKYFFERNNCGSSVAAGKSCTISVTFSPAFAYGTFFGAVSVTDNGGGSPQQLPLRGFHPTI
jgi:hypothetical protein